MFFAKYVSVVNFMTILVLEPFGWYFPCSGNELDCLLFNGSVVWDFVDNFDFVNGLS